MLSVLKHQYFCIIITYINVDIAKTDGGVGDDAGVERVEIRDGLGVGNEAGHRGQKDDQNEADHHRVETFVVLHFARNVPVDLSSYKKSLQELFFAAFGKNVLLTWMGPETV